MPPERQFPYKAEGQSREFSYRDPLETIRRTHGRSSWQTRSEHRVWRNLYQTLEDRSHLSGMAFDRSSDCDECRPYSVKPWLHRILEADWEEMHFALAPASHRRLLTDRLRRRNVKYVSIPIFAKAAFLTTASGSENAERVPIEEWASLAEKLLNLRVGKKRISYSRDFLPDTDRGGYEAFHKGTSRRCGHNPPHPSKEKAEACARETGLELDGDTTGWYARPVSGTRTIGTLSVIQRDKVINCLRSNRIRYVEVLGQGRFDLELEPIVWSDPRFVALRRQLGFESSPSFNTRTDTALRPRISRDGRFGHEEVG